VVLKQLAMVRGVRTLCWIVQDGFENGVGLQEHDLTAVVSGRPGLSQRFELGVPV